MIDRKIRIINNSEDIFLKNQKNSETNYKELSPKEKEVIMDNFWILGMDNFYKKYARYHFVIVPGIGLLIFVSLSILTFITSVILKKKDSEKKESLKTVLQNKLEKIKKKNPRLFNSNNQKNTFWNSQNQTKNINPFNRNQ